MRIANIIAAAGLALAGLTAATGAEAQTYRGYGYGYDQRYNRYDQYNRDDRYNRYDQRRWDRGHHYGWNRDRYYNSRYHRRCWTEWRYDEPVTVCRR